MDQKLEGKPNAVLRLDGRKVTRSDVSNDWGTRLQWKVTRDGKEVASVTAGLDLSFESSESAAGKYEIVLQQFHYLNYKKGTDGKFIDSKYVDISEPVSYTI